MTPADAEAVLGTPGRADGRKEAVNHAPRDLSDLWGPVQIERDRALVKADNWFYRDYQIGPSMVAVSCRGSSGRSSPARRRRGCARAAPAGFAARGRTRTGFGVNVCTAADALNPPLTSARTDGTP